MAETRLSGGRGGSFITPIEDVFKQYIIDTPADQITSEGLKAYQEKIVLGYDMQAYQNKAVNAAGSLWDQLKQDKTLIYLLVALVVVAFVAD